MKQPTITLTPFSHELQTVTDPPDSLQIRTRRIPEILRIWSRWVLWRYTLQDGAWRKLPLQPNGKSASSIDPKTWHSFRKVVAAYRAGGWDGIGFMLGGGVIGIDLDRCRNPLTGEIDAWGQEIIDYLSSWTEISPSGTGCHVYFLANTIIGRKKGRLEAYSRNRFFAVTGLALNDRGIEARQSEFGEFVATHFGTAERGSSGGQELTRWSAECVEREVPTWLRARVTVKRRRDKDCAALYAGRWQQSARYPSHSEADLALATKLLRITERDLALVDLLFRRSGLMRNKWERTDYRERTLDRARWEKMKRLTARDTTASVLLHWLLRHGPEVRKRDCFRACSHVPRKKLDKELQKLVRRRMIRIVVKRGKTGGRPSQVIRIHPKLF